MNLNPTLKHLDDMEDIAQARERRLIAASPKTQTLSDIVANSLWATTTGAKTSIVATSVSLIFVSSPAALVFGGTIGTIATIGSFLGRYDHDNRFDEERAKRLLEKIKVISEKEVRVYWAPFNNSNPENQYVIAMDHFSSSFESLNANLPVNKRIK